MVSVGDHRIRVAVRGAGRPLLLVMGIGASLDMWSGFEEELAPRGYQLVSFDLPGVGGSPAAFPPSRMRGLARTSVGVLDALGIGSADVLGVSFGGVLAQEIAHQSPDRVERLVLCATGPGLGGVPGSPRVLRHMATPHRYRSPEYAAAIAGTLYGGDARVDPARHAAMTGRFVRPPSWFGYLSQLYAIAGWSSLPWLCRLAVPTLVMHGDDDPIVPLVNGRILAALLPEARLHVVEGGGHLFLLDRTAEAAAVVDEFLSAEP